MATACIIGVDANTRAGRRATCLLDTTLHAAGIVGAVASYVEAIAGAACGLLTRAGSILFSVR